MHTTPPKSVTCACIHKRRPWFRGMLAHLIAKAKADQVAPLRGGCRLHRRIARNEPATPYSSCACSHAHPFLTVLEFACRYAFRLTPNSTLANLASLQQTEGSMTVTSIRVPHRSDSSHGSTGKRSSLNQRCPSPSAQHQPASLTWLSATTISRAAPSAFTCRVQRGGVACMHLLPSAAQDCRSSMQTPA